MINITDKAGFAKNISDAQTALNQAHLSLLQTMKLVYPSVTAATPIDAALIDDIRSYQNTLHTILIALEELKRDIDDIAKLMS